ncbi:DUF305 domain-containing protein [Streptomyces sp. URMC 123]|uniref:DUF305 domain-containing protein n=1 Tax=Streptomyces sp. URMC 123 TaxID=3423403 RepID=UPI003F1B9B86
MTAHRSVRRAAARRSPARGPLVRRALAPAVVAAAAALVLTACGGSGDGSADRDKNAAPSASASPSAGSSPGATSHNAADVSFAKGMIPHHRQAVEMSRMAATRASSQEVKTLAAEIEKAQAPEIEKLSGWLTIWGEQVPAASAGMDHSGHGGGQGGGHDGMAGMMSAEEMADLEKASGEAFDTAFLRLMVKHHQGAVDMARTEKSKGAHQPAKDMADAIITSQSAEITRMNALLGKG